MATITTLSNAVGAATQPARSVRPQPYVVENTISLAAAVTAKGSALAAADVIEALQIPAHLRHRPPTPHASSGGE